MNKKYQFFVSSTYLDLKEERKKVMKAILEAEQIPAGMELFSAADEEQWQIIKETISASDYYILIWGMRYGSVFDEGEYTGISYTEREFDYADAKGIPILSFIISDDTEIALRMTESDPVKASRLIQFKEKAKSTQISFGRIQTSFRQKLPIQFTSQLCEEIVLDGYGQRNSMLRKVWRRS